MRFKIFFHALAILVVANFLGPVGPAAGQQLQPDVIMQGFYWNTHPGDITTNQGVWWDTLATVAGNLYDSGFRTVWVPPPSKGFAGAYDMGYGIYDYYDLGEFNQKGATRTRHGNRGQFDAMITGLHSAGLRVMADVVLNHRGGADAQAPHECNDPLNPDDWTVFNPLSGRFPGVPAHFHPNNTHCDVDWPYHQPLFFQDICYFNPVDNIPPDAWYFGPHNLGPAADSLVAWSRWLFDSKGIDELRLDAVKHIEPGFLAPFLVEQVNGSQPFAVGEFFDGDMGLVKSYHDQVEAFNTTIGTGSKDANLALFDFNLRYALRDLCNDTGGGFNMWDLNSRGLRFNPGGALPAEDIVTFVESHDTDRTGFVVVACPGTIQYGNTCLDLTTDSGHDPVVFDKHMAYAYILAAEGRPTVFWKDWYWYHLADEIKWLMTLRRATATGNSTPIQSLNPWFNSGHGGDLFVLERAGSGSGADGAVLAMNDNPGNTYEVWVDTPFQDAELRDYSDAFLLESTHAFGDTRALMKANARNYAWFAPTGLYPQPPGEPASSFILGNHLGAKLHYLVLRAGDLNNFIINGSPIQPGDEIAVLHTTGTDAVGLGRIGQSVRWDGVNDMIVEVLGGSNAGEAKGGLLDGDALRLAVYDRSTDKMVVAGSVNFAAAGTNFTLNAKRPASRGSAGVSASTSSDNGLYQTGAISLVTGFTANASDLVLLEAKVWLQGPYNTATHEMGTYLSSNSLIPTTSPYPEDPRTVTAIPADAVDWVLVQLRSTATGAAAASKSAFLRKDGRIVADDGVTAQIGLDAPAGSYYVLVKQRNHLGIMSANPVALSSSSAALYDFSSAQAQAYGLNPMFEVETGVFAMRAGDGNQDGGVDALDRNLVWRPQNGTGWTYQKLADFNLDGGIDALDRNLYWRPNNGNGTQVP